MREIRFRVWEPRKKIMEEDQTAKFWLSQGFDKHTEKPVHFMQYTGLRDKNGVEIYEGDILAQHRHMPDKLLVNHSVVKFGNVVVGGYEEGFTGPAFYRADRWIDDDGSGYQFQQGFSDESFVVVGNIYENGDLLK